MLTESSREIKKSYIFRNQSKKRNLKWNDGNGGQWMAIKPQETTDNTQYTNSLGEKQLFNVFFACFGQNDRKDKISDKFEFQILHCFRFTIQSNSNYFFGSQTSINLGHTQNKSMIAFLSQTLSYNLIS